MDFCDFNINQQFKDVDEEISKAMKEDLRDLRSLQDIDDAKFQEGVNAFVEKYNAYYTGKATINVNQLIVQQSIVDFVTRPEFEGDLAQGLQSKVMQTNKYVPGAGLNFETLKKSQFNRYVTSFANHLQSKNMLSAVRSGEYDKEVYIAIASGQVNGLKDGIAKEFAKTIKHFQDLTHAGFNNAYVPVKYRKDFVVNRVYSPVKMQAMGFESFAKLILNSLDIDKTFQFSNNRVAVEQIVNTFKSKGSFEALKESNPIIKSLWERFEDKDFDPFTQEEMPWFVKSTVKRNKAGAFRRLDKRTWVFLNPETEWDVLSKLSPYDTLYEMYMGGAVKASKEIAMYKTWGPLPTETFDTLQALAKEVMPPDRVGSFNSKLESYKHLMYFGSQRPTSIAAKTAQNLNSLGAANVLGRAVISQVMDPFVQYTHQVIKSQDFVRPLVNQITTRIASLPAAIRGESLEMMYSQQQSFNQMVEDAMTDPSMVTTKMAELVQRVGMSKFANSLTWMSSFKQNWELLNKISSKDKLDPIQSRLMDKYNINLEDLKYLKRVAGDVKTPYAIQHLNAELFADNPRGIKPERYRDTMTNSLTGFMQEQISIDSSVPGMRERYVRTLGFTDVNSTRRAVLSMFTNLMSTPLKILFENVGALQLATGKSNVKGLIKDPKTYAIAGAMATVYFTGALLADVLRRMSYGEDADDIIRDYEKHPDKLVKVFLRSNAASFFGDFIANADTPQKVLVGGMKPGVETVFRGVVIPKLVIENAVKGDELMDKKVAKEVTNQIYDLIPGYNLIWLGPLTKEFEKSKKKLIRRLD